MRINIVLALLAIVSVPQVARADNVDDEWSSFRNTYPAHVQSLALSKPTAAGSRILIISEPPPDTLPKAKHQEQLKRIFRSHLSNISLKRHYVALHGWVEDIVVSLAGYGGDAGQQQLDDDVAYLAETLWGTTYKFTPLALGSLKTPAPWSAPKNLSIRHSELREWLVDGKLKLAPVSFPAATPQTLRQLVDKDRTGAFMTAEMRGLVVLLMRRDKKFEEFRTEFRKFAIDSDLIFGAVRLGSNYIALVGREREASLDAMPPLRFETARLLATSRKPELAQSYERTHVFAGRLEGGDFKGNDWAPIYLSPELVDTELGSTLNLTDQMLKSWSGAGKVSYHGFDQYPRPAQYPFENQPITVAVAKIEPKITQTLFNWNTTGAFSSVVHDIGDTAQKIETLVVLNSGSLPLIYKDETQPAFDGIFAPFEEKGYAYFRSLRDPLLTRVVSYQMIFQVTRDQPFASETPTRVVSVTPPAEARTAVDELVQESPDLSDVTDHDVDAFCQAAVLSGLFPSRTECGQAIALRVVTAEAYKHGSDSLRKAIVGYTLDRSQPPADLSLERLQEAQNAIVALSMNKTATVPVKLEPVVAFVLARYFQSSARLFEEVEDDDRLAMFKAYAADQGEDPDSYIRTARVVVSQNSLGAVGGHNLSGIVTRIESNASVAAGDVRITQRPDGVALAVNPKDVDQANALARTYAKQTAAENADRVKVQAALQKTLAEKFPPRDFRSALLFDRPNEAERGLVVAARSDADGVRFLGGQPVAADAVLAQLAKQLEVAVIVVKRGDEFIVICVYCETANQTRALSQVALRESIDNAIAQAPLGAERRVHFDGFSFDQVESVRATMAFGKGPPPPIPPVVTGAAAEPPPWSRGGWGGGSDGGPPGKGGRGAASNQKLLVFRKAADRGHQLEVRYRNGTEFRSPSPAELKTAYAQLNEAVNWQAGTIKLVQADANYSKWTSYELVIPKQQPAGTEAATFSGKLHIRWKEVPTAGAQQEATKVVKEQRARTAGPYQRGIEDLIDRLRSLKVDKNAIEDVRFFLENSVFDAVITQKVSPSADSRG